MANRIDMNDKDRQATIELCSNETLKIKILSGKVESIDDCVDMDEVKWHADEQ